MRKIGVFGERVLGRDQRRNLQKQAVLAQPQVQREGRFGKIEFVEGEQLSHGGVAPRSKTLSSRFESHRRQRTRSSILRVYQTHAQYAPELRQTAMTVFTAIAKSLSMDQFST